MAMLFFDGFDHYTLPYLKWTRDYGGGGVTTTGGRRNGGTFNSAYSWGKVLPSNNGTIVMGAAIKPLTAENSVILGVQGSTNVLQVSLYLNGYGGISICRANASIWYGNGANLLGSTRNFVLTTGVWSYVELKIKIGDSDGFAVIHVNGVNEPTTPDLSSGQNTHGDGVSHAIGNVSIGVSPWGGAVDDLYVLDTSGTLNNDFLGDVRVDSHYPTTPAGAHSEWTRSTGADQWATVDEPSNPNITDYNSTLTLNAIDTLNIQDLKPAGGTIKAVQTLIYHSKADAGDAFMVPVMRSGGVDYEGATVAPSADSWIYTLTAYEQNPSGPHDWDETDFNAIEVGYKKTG